MVSPTSPRSSGPDADTYVAKTPGGSDIIVKKETGTRKTTSGSWQSWVMVDGEQIFLSGCTKTRSPQELKRAIVLKRMAAGDMPPQKSTPLPPSLPAPHLTASVCLLRCAEKKEHSPFKLNTALWPDSFPKENGSPNLLTKELLPPPVEPKLPTVKAMDVPIGFPYNPYMPIVLIGPHMRMRASCLRSPAAM